MKWFNWTAFHPFLLLLRLFAWNIFFVLAEDKSLNGRNINVLPLGVMFQIEYFASMTRNNSFGLLAHPYCDGREKRNRSHCKIVRCFRFGFRMDFREAQLYVSLLFYKFFCPSWYTLYISSYSLKECDSVFNFVQLCFGQVIEPNSITKLNI